MTLSLAGRVLFVLFLPGYSILQAIASRQFSSLEKLVLSPIVGLAYTSLTALYLSATNIPINSYTVILSVLLLSLPLLAYSWKKHNFRINLEPYAFSLPYVVLATILVLTIVLIITPLPMNGIWFPMGDDPATSTLAASMIVQQGKIPQSWAPYLPELSHFSFPPGFPSVAAYLYLLDPTQPLPIQVALFAPFFAVIPAEIYILTRKLSSDIRIALCAAAFSAMLSFGLEQMMVSGRFPELAGTALTLGLMVFVFLYSISGSRRLLLLAGALLAALFLTYTVSFITATLFVVLFFALGLLLFQNKRRSLLGGVAVIVVGVGLSLPWILTMSSRLTAEIPPKEHTALIAWFNTNSVKAIDFPSNILGYWAYWLLLTGVVCLLAIYARKRTYSFLLAWFLSVGVLLANEIFQVHFPEWFYLQTGSFLNPLMAFPLSVLAGYGFVKLYSVLKGRLQRFACGTIRMHLPIVLVASLLLASFYFFAQPTLDNAGLRVNRISTADYDALTWLRNNTPPDAVVFNDHWVGTASEWIPAFSQRLTIMPLLSISEVGWTDLMFTREDQSLVVANSPGSSQALSILQSYNVSYVYLSNQCSKQVQSWRNNYNPDLFLESAHYKLVFNDDNAWIFKVTY